MPCLVRAVTTSLSEALSGEISSVPEESAWPTLEASIAVGRLLSGPQTAEILRAATVLIKNMWTDNARGLRWCFQLVV